MYVSHQGLTESEITNIFKIQSNVWSPFYFAMEYFLVSHLGNFGLVHACGLSLFRHGPFLMSKVIAGHKIESEAEVCKMARPCREFVDCTVLFKQKLC